MVNTVSLNKWLVGIQLVIITSGCAHLVKEPRVLKVSIEEPPPEWHAERAAVNCELAGEILTLSDGNRVVILLCPTGEYIGANLITGRIVK